MGQVGVPLNSFMVAKRKQEVVRLLLEGNILDDIRRVMHISYQTLLTYLRDPEVRQQIQDLNAKLAGEIDEELYRRFRDKAELVDELALIALDEMKIMMQDRNLHPSVRAKLIDSALDRHPEVSRTKKLDITSRTLTLKGEDLLAAAQVAKEMEESRERRESETAVPASTEDPQSQQNLIRD